MFAPVYISQYSFQLYIAKGLVLVQEAAVQLPVLHRQHIPTQCAKGSFIKASPWAQGSFGTLLGRGCGRYRWCRHCPEIQTLPMGILTLRR